MQKDWFKDWFDSPYYHILYKHRDEQEAQYFLDNLVNHLDLPAGSRVLDLACGRGRHSVYLNQKGYDVTGLDLSPQNILFANRFANATLCFDVHDMRRVYRENFFRCVLNLFTSFGYFATAEENQQVIRSIYTMLLPGGKAVLDYLNAEPLVVEDRPVETTIDGIRFRFRKKREGDHILKFIHVNDAGTEHEYMESVRVFSVSEFREMFAAAGLHVEEVYGDYDLRIFDPAVSPRLIITATKP
jgi:SAM-dependent methyltransferase